MQLLRQAQAMTILPGADGPKRDGALRWCPDDLTCLCSEGPGRCCSTKGILVFDRHMNYSSSGTQIWPRSVSVKPPRLNGWFSRSGVSASGVFSVSLSNEVGVSSSYITSKVALGEAASGLWTTYRTGGHVMLCIRCDPSRSRRCDPGRNLTLDPLAKLQV